MKYEVQSADTLVKRALVYGIAWPELYEYDCRTGDGGDTCG